MKLTVFSHKLCQLAEESPTGYATDGGFPLQMEAISRLFSATNIVVPCRNEGMGGVSPLVGNNLHVVPLTSPTGEGIWRKIGFPLWLLKNSWTLLKETYYADAVHVPIPGDIGTIGMVLALVFRKPLFVRHCGNWMVQRTLAERFWKWCMERFASERNVMLATGGGDHSPSKKNERIKWIFSTSLHSTMEKPTGPQRLSSDGELRLIIACRQEERKGTDVVIKSMPAILEVFPQATLDVVGGGSMLPYLEDLAHGLGVVDRVIFHGKVSQSRVRELLRPAHIFCYPTTASEGFPKVVLEALACGLPVITTKVSVLPHLILGSQSGLILDEISSFSFAEAVVELGSDESMYGRMSENALRTSAEYTLERWGSFIEDELCRSWGLGSLRVSQPKVAPQFRL